MAEVIRFLRKKASGNIFDPPTYLGAEQRFVGPLRSSGVNNLEEQYILGTNTYTESYINENNQGIVIKKYCDNEVSDNYYKVVSTYELNDPYYKNFFFNENSLYLPAGLDNNFIMEENYPTSFVTVREDNLYYYNGQEDILVLTKTVQTKYEENNGIKKKIVKETMDNHLINND